MSPCLSQDSSHEAVCHCDNLSRTIVHLRTVLQPEICRFPERHGRARSSIAAQTQPFEKAKNPKDTSYHPLRHGFLRHRRHGSRIHQIRGVSFRRLVRLLYAPACTSACSIMTLGGQQRTKLGGTSLNTFKTRTSAPNHDHSFAINTRFCRTKCYITRASAGSNLTITLPHHVKHHHNDKFMRKDAHDITMAAFSCSPCRQTGTASTPSCTSRFDFHANPLVLILR